MIAVVALLVIGPEKLPKVARTAGAIIGRLQRYAAQVKDEVNREVRFAELQQLQDEIRQGAEEIQSSITEDAEFQQVSPKSRTTRPKVDKPQSAKPKSVKPKSVKPRPAKSQDDVKTRSKKSAL